MKNAYVALLGLVTGVLMIMGSQQKASAIGPFKDGFFKLYVESDSANEDLKKAAKASTGKCWICHVNMLKQTPKESGLGKRVRNNFGKALSQFLDKDDISARREKAIGDFLDESDDDKAELAKIEAEIEAAIKKVEAMQSAEDGKTFGDLIKSGKLPGNGEPDPDDLKAAREWKAKQDAEES